MGIALKPGSRLFSAACSAEFIVVKAPTSEVEITIGGRPAVIAAEERDEAGSVLAGHGGGASIGKRYVDAENTAELLCTKPGDGLPALDGEILVLKESKPLPASD